MLLQLIADKPSHGYELIKAIEERFGGGYSPSPGVVYPTLTLLEEWASPTVRTRSGRQETLRRHRRGPRRTRKEPPHPVGHFRADGSGPLAWRSVLAADHAGHENLKIAMKYRLSSSELTEAEVSAIAAALDAAALAVEQAGRKPQES